MHVAVRLYQPYRPHPEERESLWPSVRTCSPSRHIIANVTQGQRQVIEQWRNGFHLNQDCHYSAAAKAERVGRMIGVAVVLLSTAVGASIFRSLAALQGDTATIVTGMLSLVAAALAAVQTFMDFPGTAEKHRLAAVAYGDLRREMDRLLASDSEADVDSRMASVQQRWQEVDTIAPSIPPKVLKGGPTRLARRRDEMAPFRSQTPENANARSST